MDRDRITEVRIRGYRCIEDAIFAPYADRAALVGANASGKTSVLDAVQFVSDLVRYDEKCLAGERRGALGVTLPLRDLGYLGGEVDITLSFQTGGRGFTYRVVLEPKRLAYVITVETLSSAHEPVLIERTQAGARVLRADGARESVQPIGNAPLSTVLSNCDDPITYPSVAAAHAFISGICMLQLTPPLMRAGTATLERPDRYGRDLPGRLHQLLTEAPEQLPQFLEFMRDFVGWTALRTPMENGSVAPNFREESALSAVSLLTASDGTAVEAYLAALALAPPASVSVLLVDEPGTTIYPRAQQRIAELLSTLSTERQVIVASHAPEFLGEFADARRIWLATRKPGSGTILRRFLDVGDAGEDITALGTGHAAIAAAETLPEASE